MKIVAVTACPTGIAHTYMAAEALERFGNTLGHSVKVETQGAMGIENELTAADIAGADYAVFAVDVAVENEDRFDRKKIIRVPVAQAIKSPKAIFEKMV